MSTRFTSPWLGSSTRTIIKQMFDDMGITPRIEQHQVWFIWDKVVGSQIAAHARPASIRNNVLEVRVDHAVWMQQLQLLKPQLLAKLNRELGNNTLEGMYLRRRNPEPVARKKTEPAPSLPELSTMEQKKVERLTAHIKDAGVRKAMQDLLTKQKRLDKLRRIQAGTQQLS